MVRKEPSSIILSLLATFASILAVLYTPALPEITRFLHITESQGQLTITVFLVGYALGSLPFGPFSNRFGRKSAIYLGIILAIVGSFLVILVGNFPNYWLFLLGRFLMALGSSVGLKIAFTIAADVYQHEKLTKKISYFMLAGAVGPGIAVAMGGFLTNQFGWVSSFYCSIAYSALLLVLCFRLPETCLQKDPNALDISKVQAGYSRKLKNMKFLLCAFLMGCGTSFVYLFASKAPFIGIDRIGLKPDQYGLLNFIPPIGMIIGTALTHRLAGKRDALSNILLGIMITFLAALAMLFLFSFNIITVWSLFGPMPFLYIGLSLIYANASALAMSHAKDKSNASAVMNFLNMGTSVVTLFLIGALPHPAYIMPLAFALIAVVMLILRRRIVLMETS